ncbi:MAG: 2-C-methyl-D-erythritol 4-phosphate cytidylyltransferase [Spirochaetales bacterium]|nr:2-C-methyl-D-erythritol 4-phosphate cytidylyltransferase [Spirochaetales bacterium]
MGGVKKELALIDGVPVLLKTARVFAGCGKIGHIVITHPPGDTGLQAVFEREDLEIIWAPGGETRQESVYHGLLALERHAPEYVLIHDAARPWVTCELINAVLEGAREHGACIPVVSHINAPKQLNGAGEIIGHLDRAFVVGAQTPQGFRYSEILRAHEAARRNSVEYPDDAEAYHNAIGSVFAVPGDPDNRKITFRYDV